LLFVSGQLPFTAQRTLVEGGIREQTRQCLQNVAAILATEGATLGHVVRVMVWLTDTADFAAFNATYAEYFPGVPPARATVCSALMVPGARIEIEATAYLPAGH
jgi:2-iminobutanoate/2-iminopropanoate deaminase